MTAHLALMMVFAGGMAAAGTLTVTGGKCEQRNCPLGIDVPQPVLGWTLASALRGDCQTAYQIVAASDPALLAAGAKPDLWDSGKVDSSASLGVVYGGKPLVSGQRVWWQVRAWDRAGEAGPYGAPQWWEMALMAPADWHGKWISDGKPAPTADADFYKNDPAPLLRKGFKVTGPVKRARIHISGLGYHELSLNGGKVGDHLLDPAWTAYGKRVLYSSYDVTDALHQGDNTLGVMLGNGWFNPLPLRMWGHLNLRDQLTIGRPRVIMQMNVEYADGSRAEIVTDETWRVGDGPIVRNNVYLGEVYDARKECAGWDKPGFDDSAWHAAAVETGALGVLRAQSAPPIRCTEELPAVKVTGPKPGVFIYDFGQNFTGSVRLRLEAAAGTKVVMRYGELLNKDGSLNPLTSVCGQIKGRGKPDAGDDPCVGDPEPPRVAWQGDTYFAKGGGVETYTPRFTFHGFRYLEITGLPAALPLAALTGLRIHSDVPDTGSFACSNERFNRIQQMCRHTFVSNIIGQPSDCPHRERFGYGGDIVPTCEAFMLNFDMTTFYQKVVGDWADSALPDGMLTDTAPSTGINYCGIGWRMVHPLLVSQLYRYQGDRRLIEEQFDIAKRWLLLEAAKYPGGIVKDGLGDHESLVPAPAPPLVTTMFYQSATMLADMARSLGRTGDAKDMDALAGKIRAAYQQSFVDPKTGTVGTGSQACQALALYTGLVPQTTVQAAVERLVEDVRDKHHGHLSTGIFGTKMVLNTLSCNGHAELAYQVANQADFPSWGWMLENGATTLWEHWAGSDNTYSNDHPMFGSVSQWFFNCPGGIRPAADAVGFDKIVVAPQLLGDLQWVKCSYQSVRGPVACEWKKSAAWLELRVAVPVGATATVWVPAKDAAAVTEGGMPAARAEGVKFLRHESGSAVYAVGGGSYVFGSR